MYRFLQCFPPQLRHFQLIEPRPPRDINQREVIAVQRNQGVNNQVKREEAVLFRLYTEYPRITL